MGSYTGFQFLNPMIGGGLYGSYDGSYLLDDEFSDTLAAGAVNGTPATPGPGTRVAVDSDTPKHMSIGSGVLSIAPHTTPAWGDPGLWYGVMTRAAGQVLTAKIIPTEANKAQEIGWDINQAGTLLDTGLYFSNTGSLYKDGQGLALGTYTAVTYWVALIHRVAGGFYFIKGGAFTNWTLLWIDVGRISTTTYPGMLTNNATFSVDYIRIPAQLWTPTPLASDSFNRGNGVLGSTDGLAVAEVGGNGLPWTDSVGTWAILGNQAAASVLAGGVAIATVESGKTDGLVTGTLTRSAGTLGIVLRYVDSDNFMRAEHDGTNCLLITRIAGVEATVITAIVAIGAGVIRVISQGTSHALYLNNMQVGATTVVAGLTTGTRIGLHTTDTGNTFDTFYDFARGTGGEYVALDAY